MKKYILATGLFLAPVIASANPGCGLGAEIFKGKSGMLNHVLAATTNGFLGNQTFGMTFGTLGCDVNREISYVAQFINGNMDQIAVDIATGSGESLAALASLMQISSEDQSHFNEVLRANFKTLYPTATVNAEQVYEALNQVMAADERLAPYAA